MLDMELLGVKVINAKKELYLETVPTEVKDTIKCIAQKFHALSNEIALRRKMTYFKTFALVLRGQNVQGQINAIYDLEKLKFKQ